jgi:hypothetical protein
MEKTYEGFLNIFKHRNIKKMCRKYKIEEYTINDDDSIDIHGYSFTLRDRKFPLKLRSVRDGFYYAIHSKLIENSPINVGGNFYCSNNVLTSLVGGPERVGGNYDCRNNKLTSLVGCASHVGGELDCSSNKYLTSFEGFPRTYGAFRCRYTNIDAIYQLFDRDASKIELFNDYDIIRDDTIILERLMDFLEETKKDRVYKVSKKYLDSNCIFNINNNTIGDFEYKFI